MIRSSTPGMAVAVLAGAMAACGSTAAGRVQTTPTVAAAAQADLVAIAKAQADSARYPYTSADVHFMSAMIGHHAQAIQMADWAPTHGARSSVRILAERIINAQQDEITTMQRWLADRRQRVPEAIPQGMKMMMDGVEHVMLMPGMLTPDQLTQLDQSRGTEFDRRFLTFMIQHHRGAVTMVKELLGTHGAAQDEIVYRFASDVNVDQATEIDRMEKMLAALSSRPN